MRKKTQINTTIAIRLHIKRKNSANDHKKADQKADHIYEKKNFVRN